MGRQETPACPEPAPRGRACCRRSCDHHLDPLQDRWRRPPALFGKPAKYGL